MDIFYPLARSAALSLRFKMRQNPHMPTGISTAITIAEVIPAFLALYVDCSEKSQV